MAQLYLSRMLSGAITALLFIHSPIALCADGDHSVEIHQSAIRRAVILVGGIYESSHYFDNWVPELSAPDTITLGWDHDHRSMSMMQSSRLLAKRIEELNDKGIVDVTILAHSMGGLVAKGAIDELSRMGKAGSFHHIRIDTFGTPWGGYTLAELASILPLSRYLSKAIGYPMGPDIGPNSDYMKDLAQPLPANAELNIYIGTADHTALPDGKAARIRYNSIEELATVVLNINDCDHVAYNQKTAPLFVNHHLAGFSPLKTPAPPNTAPGDKSSWTSSSRQKTNF
jgi:pimeloyl-ACP methyl ester carboxylesterase